MRMHSLASQGDAAALKATGAMIGLLGDNIGDWVVGGADLQAYVELFNATRSAATENKDFAAVDALKARLTEAGVEVRMSKEGVALESTASFDASKLEGLL